MVFGLLLMASSVLEQEFKEQEIFLLSFGKIKENYLLGLPWKVMLHGKCTNKMFLLNC